MTEEAVLFLTKEPRVMKPLRSGLVKTRESQKEQSLFMARPNRLGKPHEPLRWSLGSTPMTYRCTTTDMFHASPSPAQCSSEIQFDRLRMFFLLSFERLWH